MNFDALDRFVDLSDLTNATVLITGASGLIGRELVRCFSAINRRFGYGITLIITARNTDKLNALRRLYGNGIAIRVMAGNIVDCAFTDCKADYIIHCASVTESRLMISDPVEVIKTAVWGTNNVLASAVGTNVKSAVYLSSMEVYGFSEEERPLREEDMLYLDPLQVRSCYPESKRLAENLCASYFSEYNVPVKIVRLAQTFGHGVAHDDKRVFAEFARCAENGTNIVLKTDGGSKRMYLDTEDAVCAIVTVLLKGKSGEAYNAANKHTYCSIREMADTVAKSFGNGTIDVMFEIGDNACFPPSHKFRLDTAKIEKLGWYPQTDLIGMYKNLLGYWKDEEVE